MLLLTQAKQLGYDGKTLIHPSTIEKCNEVFSPSQEEVDNAQKIVQAYDSAAAEGSLPSKPKHHLKCIIFMCVNLLIDTGAGLVEVDGNLIEELHAEKARAVVAKARQLGMAV